MNSTVSLFDIVEKDKEENVRVVGDFRNSLWKRYATEAALLLNATVATKKLSIHLLNMVKSNEVNGDVLQLIWDEMEDIPTIKDRDRIEKIVSSLRNDFT